MRRWKPLSQPLRRYRATSCGTQFSLTSGFFPTIRSVDLIRFWSPSHTWWFNEPPDAPKVKNVDLSQFAVPQSFMLRFRQTPLDGGRLLLWWFYFLSLPLGLLLLVGAGWEQAKSQTLPNSAIQRPSTRFFVIALSAAVCLVPFVSFSDKLRWKELLGGVSLPSLVSRSCTFNRTTGPWAL